MLTLLAMSPLVLAAMIVALSGPGAFSLDRALGVGAPKSVAVLAVLGVVAGVVVAEKRPKLAPDSA